MGPTISLEMSTTNYPSTPPNFLTLVDGTVRLSGQVGNYLKTYDA